MPSCRGADTRRRLGALPRASFERLEVSDPERSLSLRLEADPSDELDEALDELEELEEELDEELDEDDEEDDGDRDRLAPRLACRRGLRGGPGTWAAASCKVSLL